VPVVVALRMLRQEDGEFKTSLDYTVRTCLRRKPRFRLRAQLSGRALAWRVQGPGFREIRVCVVCKMI
jgi:hypothetical protein